MDKTGASRGWKCFGVRLQRKESLFLLHKCSRRLGSSIRNELGSFIIFFLHVFGVFFLWIGKHKGSANRFGC